MAFAAPGVGMLGFMPPQPQQSTPLTPEILAAKARPRGLLGNIGAFIGSPQGSQFFRSLGAVAHDIGHGTNTFGDLMAQLEEQRRQMLQDAWMRQQQDRARMQWKVEDQQSQATDDFVHTLPPNLQALARVPGGLEMVMRQMQPAQWQHFYGRAGRINPDGTVTLGGRIPEAPRAQVSLFGDGQDGTGFTPNPAGVAAPPAVGTVEDGYRYNGGDPASPSSWSPVR